MLATLRNALGSPPPPLTWVPVLAAAAAAPVASDVSPRPPFAWGAFLVMWVVLAASVATYVMLVRRWTSRRQWLSLAQWSRESGFRIRPAKRDVLPAELRELVRDDAQVRFHLTDGRTTIVQFDTDPPAPGAPPTRWNILLRPRAGGGPAAGLRPATRAYHLVDLLPISKFAALSLGERFVVYATEWSTAHTVADSTLPALLPPDLGLILLEEHMVIEFSARAFDPIGFGRIIAVAEQVERAV